VKRAGLHILFWVAYFAFLVITEFVWVKFGSPASNNLEILLKALQACSITILPQILFAYYISYVTLVKLVSQKKKMVWYVLEIGLLFLLTVTVTQLLSHRVVGKYIYGITDVSPLYQLTQFLSFVIYTGFVSGTMIGIKYIKHQLKTAKREQELIKEKLSTELKMLRNQLNPHFLFNTLNNIYGLSRKQSSSTPDAIMKLSELLSFMLYESGKETIPVKKEVAFLDDYLSLEKLRYNQRLHISFIKDIDDYTQPLAPLLLLPLVENAFKHGASQSRFDSFIDISLSIKKRVLLFNIRNNYEPCGTEKKSTSIGLTNIKRQMELLYSEQSLALLNDGGVFHVQVQINLDSYGTF
jgi:two-component system, LytTR family, sensor kinase